MRNLPHSEAHPDFYRTGYSKKEKYLIFDPHSNIHVGKPMLKQTIQVEIKILPIVFCIYTVRRNV